MVARRFAITSRMRRRSEAGIGNWLVKGYLPVIDSSPQSPLQTDLATTTDSDWRADSADELCRAPCVVSISDLVPSNESIRSGGLNEDHARALAETDADFPPILVQRSSRRVWDGLHRLRAEQIRGRDTIAVRFFDGDDAAAFVAGVRANITHGLPLSLTDRRAAAGRIIQLYPAWSNRAIAFCTGISDKTVGAIRERGC